VSPGTPTAARAGLRDRWVLAGAALTAAATLLVVAAYLVRARALVAYPWDWSPDEGLFLDWGRRVVEDPGSLYTRQAVPLPSTYGPLLPLLLAAVVRLPHPLAAARLLALAWTAAGAAAVVALLRRSPWPAWAAGLALYLAPFDLSFWHLLVRPDGAMTTLWLCAAVPLLPRALERGADRLRAGRLAAGTALLLAAVLAKPTAVLHGAPLVLGWFLVDRRSGWRLLASVGGFGLLLLAVLQAATGGGFLWASLLWTTHPMVPGHATAVVARFATLAWPVLAVAAGTGLAAGAARHRPHRDPALLLLAGGLAVAPLLGKQGAAWNYLVPLFAATVVVAGRWGSLLRGGPAAASLLALALAATRVFPLPTAADEATARAFYGFTQEVQHRSRGLLLASRPDLVYFLAGQPAQVDGGSFVHLAAAGVPGTEGVLRSLEEGRYALVVWTWPLPDRPRWTGALLANYVRVGECRLGYYYGAPFASHLALRRGLAVPFEPPPGSRCEAVRPNPSNEARRP
jgi:hypothetical protein